MAWARQFHNKRFRRNYEPAASSSGFLLLSAFASFKPHGFANIGFLELWRDHEHIVTLRIMLS
jgi:hypothetical protein